MPVAAAPELEAPRLDLPVQCVVGRDCWVTKYVDLDPGPEMRDFACGRLADNGHKGTDFAVRDGRAMEAGVIVRAAAAGTVLGIRDGMDDVSTRTTGLAAVKDKECGNGVVLGHGRDWHTQYCHLRKGSVRVRKGDEVKAGAPLGMIGLSGASEYPHLHFEVRRSGKTVDPFVGDGVSATCGLGDRRLWSDNAAAILTYRPVAVFNSGLSATPPDEVTARAGALASNSFPADAEAMIAWAEVLGLKAGDVIDFAVRLPDGKIRSDRMKVDKSVLHLFPRMSMKRTGERWPAGRYQLEVSVSRPSHLGEPVVTRSETVVP
ncbi:MAG: M23 family metallopeptidase [Alphaproteobacteria bacterium]